MLMGFNIAIAAFIITVGLSIAHDEKKNKESETESADGPAEASQNKINKDDL